MDYNRGSHPNLLAESPSYRGAVVHAHTRGLLYVSQINLSLEDLEPSDYDVFCCNISADAIMLLQEVCARYGQRRYCGTTRPGIRDNGRHEQSIFMKST